MKNILNKTLEKNYLSNVVRRMLNHFDKHNFFISSGPTKYFGSNGELVKEHIRHEWLLNNLFNCDEPAFLVNDKIENEYAKPLGVVDKLPFSLVNLNKVFEKVILNESSDENVSLYFKPKTYTSLKKQTLCYPSLSTAFFHRQQRERKIWWRKLSSLPGRFAISEMCSDDNGNPWVEITTDFPWGSESIETIRCLAAPTELQVKEGRKTVSPHIVETECRLETAALMYLCDAYDPINEEAGRDMMRFHRKLAPFKVAFTATATTANVAKELSDLALVLARKIRKVGIPCFLLPDLVKTSLENSFIRADSIGIPYTIVLNDKTLTDGIIGIRSRDTTLKEQSHVGIVVPYVEQLMKNY